MSDLVHEVTGEAMTVRDYVDQQRAIEKRIGRLDNNIADLRATLKAEKGERDKAVAALRSLIRESKWRGKVTAVSPRAKAAKS